MRETERERDRQRERETERERQRQRQREKCNEKLGSHYCLIHEEFSIFELKLLRARKFTSMFCSSLFFL